VNGVEETIITEIGVGRAGKNKINWAAVVGNSLFRNERGGGARMAVGGSNRKTVMGEIPCQRTRRSQKRQQKRKRFLWGNNCRVNLGSPVECKIRGVVGRCYLVVQIRMQKGAKVPSVGNKSISPDRAGRAEKK